MVGSTPPEMTRAGQGRARPDRGAWRRWRAVLCVALLAALLPAAAGPAAAESDDVPGVSDDVSGVGFGDGVGTTADTIGGCHYGSIHFHGGETGFPNPVLKPSELHDDEADKKELIQQSGYGTARDLPEGMAYDRPW